MALIAELTHRCPLQCPYCANPIDLHHAAAELDTSTWQRVLDEAAGLGVLQLHFSGGEPTARRDLPALIRTGSEAGLYTNLITSGVTLNSRSLAPLVQAGLDHVQISLQDAAPANADRIAGFSGSHGRKLVAIKAIRQTQLALTLNFVVHRQNVANVPAMLEFAESVGAARVEIAHTQYHGWALANREALLPTREQVDVVTTHVDAARKRMRNHMTIDYVVPDYYARLPKTCMGGWGRRMIVVTPGGRALPCHVAESLPNLNFPSVRDVSLTSIWYDSLAFNYFRGVSWMREPCRSCDRREVDWGGCRCQAFALTGNAENADPACEKSSQRALLEAAIVDLPTTPPNYLYRRYANTDNT